MTLALGIDPGTATTGYGLVRLTREGSLVAVSFGVITTPKDSPAPARLEMLYQRLGALLNEHKPDTAAGPVIENWRRYGAISRRTKIYSVAGMIAALAGSAAFKATPAILIVQAVVLSLAGAFVVSRPAPPEDRAAD